MSCGFIESKWLTSTRLNAVFLLQRHCWSIKRIDWPWMIIMESRTIAAVDHRQALLRELCSNIRRLTRQPSSSRVVRMMLHKADELREYQSTCRTRKRPSRADWWLKLQHVPSRWTLTRCLDPGLCHCCWNRRPWRSFVILPGWRSLEQAEGLARADLAWLGWSIQRSLNPLRMGSRLALRNLQTFWTWVLKATLHHSSADAVRPVCFLFGMPKRWRKHPACSRHTQTL